jgi:hypothetical protein
MLRDNRHTSTYLFGAICPDRAVGAAMIIPHCDTWGMNLHLKEISAQVAPISGARNWPSQTTSPFCPCPPTRRN